MSRDTMITRDNEEKDDLVFIQADEYPLTLQQDYLQLYKQIRSLRDIRLQAKDILQHKSNKNDLQATHVLACHALGLEKGSHFYTAYKNPSSQSMSIVELIANGFNSIPHQKIIRQTEIQLTLCAEFFPESAFLLGEIYRRGYPGIDLNAENAAELHRKAAQWGHPDSLYRLGMMHYKGECGLPKNDALAYRFINQAAEQNHPVALLWKHQFDLEGLGTESNPTAGLIALLKALIILYHDDGNSIISQDNLYYITHSDAEKYDLYGLIFDEDFAPLRILQNANSNMSAQEILENLGYNCGMNLIVRMDLMTNTYNERNLENNLKKFDELLTLPDSIKIFRQELEKDEYIGHIFSENWNKPKDSTQLIQSVLNENAVEPDPVEKWELVDSPEEEDLLFPNLTDSVSELPISEPAKPDEEPVFRIMNW